MGCTVWAVLAIDFGDSYSSSIQKTIAVAFALFGITTMIGLGFGFWPRRLLLIYSILLEQGGGNMGRFSVQSGGLLEPGGAIGGGISGEAAR